MAGMKTNIDGLEMPAKKRTYLFTNSVALAQTVKDLQCKGTHAHGSLTDGRARKCQEYPEEFCEVVRKAVAEEKNQGSDVGDGALLFGSTTKNVEDVTPLIKR